MRRCRGAYSCCMRRRKTSPPGRRSASEASAATAGNAPLRSNPADGKSVKTIIVRCIHKDYYPGAGSDGVPHGVSAERPAERLITMAEERLIRKYANRRLYDAHDSRHVTLDDLRKLIA